MTALRSFALDDDAVDAAWSALLASDPDASVFHLPAYVRACAALGRPARTRVDLVERDGRPLGLVPIAIERQGTPTGPIEVVRFADCHTLPGPPGPLAAPADRAEVVDVWVAGLVEAADWDELVLTGLLASTGWAELLTAAGRRHGLVVTADRGEEHRLRVSLPGDGSAPRSRRVRWEVSRRRRKLTRELGAVQVREVPTRLLADGLDRFLLLAARGDEHPWRDDASERILRLGAALGDARIMRLHELEAAGQPVAASISLVGGSEWAVVATALDPVLRRYAPHVLLVSELVQSAAAEGCTAVDLLPGASPDAARIGAQAHDLVRCHLVRSS